MVEMELQSLLNASAMCGIEEGMKNGEGSTVNFIAEIADELQRERAKNAELMKRISSLEAQIQEKDKESLITNQQVSCLDNVEQTFKRRKTEIAGCRIGDGNDIKSEMSSKAINETPNMPRVDENPEDRLVNWMSTDETDFSHFDKFKDGDIVGFHEDMIESDDEDEYYEENDSNIVNLRRTCEEEPHEESKGLEMRISCLQSCSDGPCELTLENSNRLMKENREKDDTLQDIQVPSNRSNLGEEPCQMVLSGKTLCNKRPRKVPFCPKEVNRILESDALLSKNAQSHTIRKIIVFASLGIRHGCEDMYELDFNHFSILRKGDPYVSTNNPGEHVLYENPGIQRKVFYPNRSNPTLCPVQILEEEKAMRPSDPSCPSSLFLCIKYGGRTRNLPQNEYVRQQMGRNKLKSFGPIMCRMAMLVHIRSGSFFFKALGITLLFMAAFPDDIVQRETKYRNLDLLQKYYRTDKDAEGEELFHSQSIAFDAVRSKFPNEGKTASTKTKGKRQTNSSSKSHNLSKATYPQSEPSSSAQAATQFGLIGYTSIQTHAMTTAFQTTPSQAQSDASNTTTKSLSDNISYHNQTVQTPYHLFAPQPANSFMPMVFWTPPNIFPPSPYPTTYGYRAFPTNTNYVSIHPRPYHNYPSSGFFPPKMIIGGNDRKNVSASSEHDSDSDNSSSSMEEPK